jgi:hypothetical protein
MHIETIELNSTDRARLEAIVTDRNSPQKHVWRSRIVLLTADGKCAAEIMREAGVAKTCVRRWQARFGVMVTVQLIDSRTRVRCEGRVLHFGVCIPTAEGRLTDAATSALLAHGGETCLLMTGGS